MCVLQPKQKSLTPDSSLQQTSHCNEDRQADRQLPFCHVGTYSQCVQLFLTKCSFSNKALSVVPRKCVIFCCFYIGITLITTGAFGLHFPYSYCRGQYCAMSDIVHLPLSFLCPLRLRLSCSRSFVTGTPLCLS